MNPWQVEPLSIQSAFPPTKKFRASITSELGTDGGDAELFFPIRGFTSSSLAQLNPSMLSYNTSPAGMQGARQDAIGASGFLHYADENTPIVLTADFLGSNMFPNSKASPTSLKLGNSPSENLSADSPNSGRSTGADLVPISVSNAPKAAGNFLQLFGQFIYVEKPAESGSEDDGLKERTETANAGQTLANPLAELMERLEDQCDGASTMKE